MLFATCRPEGFDQLRDRRHWGSSSPGRPRADRWRPSFDRSSPVMTEAEELAAFARIPFRVLVILR